MTGVVFLMSNQKKSDKVPKGKKDILNFLQKMNTNNDDISAFYETLKAIGKYRSFHGFSDKRRIFFAVFANV